MWRPKTWGSITDGVEFETEAEFLQYEAGADAMLKAMVEWVQEQDETTFCPDEGDEFNCFLVPTQALQQLVK